MTALALTQPTIPATLPAIPDEAEFLLARDGSLTARDPSGQWIAGCSLPYRAAQAIFKDLQTDATVACFLDPPHAAFLRAAFERIGPRRALLAIVPDPARLSLILHCDDFSAELADERLWFAVGDWEPVLRNLIESHPGLPTPAAFLRTALTPESANQELIAKAQAILSVESSRRQHAVQQLAAQQPNPPSQNRQLRVVAPTAFRLWECAGDALRSVFDRSTDAAFFDPDRPTSASPLALAQAAADAGALVAANFSRADAPHAVHPAKPWITWLTLPRIPAFGSAGPNDHLLLADPAWTPLARDAGWPANRIHPAAWPVEVRPANPAGPLALIADTHEVEVQPTRFDLSSHNLLWETLRLRLLDDPFELDDDPARYLLKLAKRFDVSPEGLDVPQFIDRLILPTYQQALARLLLRAGLPVELHGAGWQSVPDLAPAARGPLASRDAFRTAVDSASAIVHAWPLRYAHPAHALGRPVVRSAAKRRDAFLHDARLAAQGKLPPPTPASAQSLSANLIRRLLGL